MLCEKITQVNLAGPNNITQYHQWNKTKSKKKYNEFSRAHRQTALKTNQNSEHRNVKLLGTLYSLNSFAQIVMPLSLLTLHSRFVLWKVFFLLLSFRLFYCYCVIGCSSLWHNLLPLLISFYYWAWLEPKFSWLRH